MKKLLLLILSFISAQYPASATEIVVDGIYYNIGMTSAEVIAPKEGSGVTYSGDIVIPSEVNYSGMNWIVASIYDGAFMNCSELQTIKIPETVWYIGQKAFYGCSSLTSIEIPGEVSSIYNSTFAKCSSLESVTLPKSLLRIEEKAFMECLDLSSVTIPDEVTYIGDRAFWMCDNLNEVRLGSSVKTIGEAAFQDCWNLQKINIPNSVTTIGITAFYGCEGLTTITIPGSVPEISPLAFGGCSGLTNVTIGSRVTSIGSSAFANCSSLAEIRCENSNPPGIENSKVFENVDHTKCKVIVPEGSLDKYRSADGWKEFQNIDDESVVTGINDVKDDIEPIFRYYNVFGVEVNSSYRGIVITSGGRKIIR